jgi:hypothetical protein
MLKSTKSCVRSPNRRLMRGYESYPSAEKFDTHGEAGGRVLRHTHLGCARSYRSNKRKAIEDELCTSGESEDNLKITIGYAK